jgi:hypothetical protein
VHAHDVQRYTCDTWAKLKVRAPRGRDKEVQLGGSLAVVKRIVHLGHLVGSTQGVRMRGEKAGLAAAQAVFFVVDVGC